MKPKNSEKKYMANKAKNRRIVKKSDVKDDEQDFKINKIEKKVKELTKATKAFAQFSNTRSSIKTLVGVTSDTEVSGWTLKVLSDLAAANITAGEVLGQYATIKHIEFSYYIQASLTSVSSNQYPYVCRIVMVVIHQPAGSPSTAGGSEYPHYNSIFQSDDAAAAMVAPEIMSPYSRTERSNFEILYDKTHTISPLYIPDLSTHQVTGVASPLTNMHRVHIKPSARSEMIAYNDNDATNTDYQHQAKNQYFLLAFCNSPDDTDPPLITTNVMVDFIQ